MLTQNVMTIMRQLLTLILLTGTTLVFAQDRDSHYKKGKMKAQGGNHEYAVKEFTKALEYDPEYLNAYLQRGHSYALIHNYDGAVMDFTKALDIKPNHKWAFKNRGMAYNRMEKYKLAMRDFDQVIKLDPRNIEAYNNRGFAKKGLGDKAGACADWKKSRKFGNAEAKIILNNNHCK